MNRMIQRIIIIVVVANFLTLFSVEAEAVIYKWKDENGKIHFTDDPDRVPEEFRQNKMKLRTLPETGVQKKISKPQKKEDEGTPPEEINEVAKKTEKKSNEISEADKSALESVTAFFEKDMPRYDAIYNRPLSNGNSGKRKWKVLRNTVIATIPQKEALLEQISIAELPLLKGIASFLKQVIVEDEKLKKVLPLISDNTRPQVNNLSNRLKNQAASEEEFLKQIEEALKTPNESEKK